VNALTDEEIDRQCDFYETFCSGEPSPASPIDHPARVFGLILKQMREDVKKNQTTAAADYIPWEQFKAQQDAIPPAEVHEPDPERADLIDQIVAASLVTP
jgi:hypothetical protein